MVEYEWNEEMCREYAEGIRRVVKFDHGPWAGKIADRLKDLPAESGVLDVASGPAFLLLELAGRLKSPKLTAQDYSRHMLEIARANARTAGYEIETLECPAEKIALADDSMEVVACKQLLHEAKDVERSISEIARVLKPGGKAFIIDFDADGSRIIARMIKLLLRVVSGREMANGFWSSFCSGLPGAKVRDIMLDSGFNRVEYIKDGPNYFMIGEKAITDKYATEPRQAMVT